MVKYTKKEFEKLLSLKNAAFQGVIPEFLCHVPDNRHILKPFLKSTLGLGIFEKIPVKVYVWYIPYDYVKHWDITFRKKWMTSNFIRYIEIKRELDCYKFTAYVDNRPDLDLIKEFALEWLLAKKLNKNNRKKMGKRI
jgi:hypothetical protein